MAVDTSKRELTIEQLVAAGLSREDAEAKYDSLIANAETDKRFSVFQKMYPGEPEKQVHEFATHILTPNDGGGINTDPDKNDIKTEKTSGGKGKGRAAQQEYSAPALSEGQEDALNTLFDENKMSELLANATTAKVSNLLLGPDPKRGYLMSGGKPIKVIPELDAAKREAYSKKLEQSAENEKAWKDALAAVDGKLAVEVYINPNAVGSVLGVEFTSKASGNKPVPLSINVAPGYAIAHFAGIVAPTKDTAGFRLRKMYVSTQTATGSTQEKARISGTTPGRLEAVKAGNYIAVYKPMTEAEASAAGLASNVVAKKVPTVLTFKVVQENADPTKDPSVRTVRLKGKYDKHPVWSLDPKYASIIPPPSLGRNANCTVPTTPEQIAAQKTMLMNVMRAAVSNDVDVNAIGADATFKAFMQSVASKGGDSKAGGLNAY